MTADHPVRNNGIFLTDMKTIATALMSHADREPEGVPVVEKELLHLGTRAAVDQALSRLARSGNLIRVGRWLYVRPVQGGVVSVHRNVVRAIVTQSGEQAVPHGAAAADELG